MVNLQLFSQIPLEHEKESSSKVKENTLIPIFALALLCVTRTGDSPPLQFRLARLALDAGFESLHGIPRSVN